MKTYTEQIVFVNVLQDGWKMNIKKFKRWNKPRKSYLYHCCRCGRPAADDQLLIRSKEFYQLCRTCDKTMNYAKEEQITNLVQFIKNL